MRPLLRCVAAVLAIAIVAWSPVKGTEGARQDRPAVEAWLGSFAAGAERVTIAWGAGGLTLHLGNVVLRVDGAWHETVPTFSVRHRATWLADRQVIAIDEQHNRGAHWRHELRLEPDGQRLQKVVLSPTGTGERVQRIYARMR